MELYDAKFLQGVFPRLIIVILMVKQVGSPKLSVVLWTQVSLTCLSIGDANGLVHGDDPLWDTLGTPRCWRIVLTNVYRP